MILLALALRAQAGGCPGDLFINEILPAPAGDDVGYEWVEIYNADSSEVSLDGWVLLWGTQSLSSDVVFSDVTIPAGGFLVVGGKMVSFADVTADLTLGNAGSNGDGVQLQDCMGSVVDTVIYGPNNDDGFVDDSGSEATSLAPAPDDGVSIARVDDGADTDQSGEDFFLDDVPTPGESNASEGTPCPGQDDVKLNELLPNPASSDDDQEWIELYNAGGSAVALDGWILEWGTSGFSSSYAFPVGSSIGAGDFLVVGGALVAERDLEASIAMGNASSSGDAVRLRHCGGGVADTVVYGPDNSDGWIDDTGGKATSFAPEPSDGSSLARGSDGADTDASGVDFILSDTPSPGEANPFVAPPECHAGEETIKVNEFLPDPDGSDDGFEWVELYNSGPNAQRLDAWQLQIAKSDWEDFSFALPGGLELGAGEFLVIGAEESEAEIVADGLSLGNASTAPDGIRVVDCEGAVQDTVLYADDDELEDPLADDAGTFTVAAMSGEALSVGRADDGVDSDDNSVDFVADLGPTPGEPNDADGGGGGGDGVGKGCSKSSDAEGTKKCTTGPGAGWLGTLLAMLVAARRRR